MPHIIDIEAHHKLADRIDKFLTKYAKHSASEPDEWNGPDPYELQRVSTMLKLHTVPQLIHPPYSDFGSGCYKDMYNPEVRKEHDDIIKKFHELRNK